jgi:putative transcriptional regulator
MKKRKPTAGERMIESARQALAFAKGKENHGCEVHVPNDIDVKAIREKISLFASRVCQVVRFEQADLGTLGAWPAGSQRPRSGLSDRNRS